MQNITVFDGVGLAFCPQLAGIARGLFAAQGYIVVIRYCFRADEALLEITMNDASRLRRLCAKSNGPSARFFWPYRKICLKREQIIARTDQPIQSCLLQAKLFEEHPRFIFIQLTYFFFDLG